jgi:tetratricopeptide (TPR) repeat protein
MRGLPARRVGGWLHAHWRIVGVGLLAGVGTAAGVVAGLSATRHRPLWLLSAGACAGLAALVSLLPSRHQQRDLPDRPDLGTDVDIHIDAVSFIPPASIDAPQEALRWTIPPPVRSFTGRRDLLVALREHLMRERATALIPTTALYGMGGVGKTQLALAYAHQYRNEYKLGWWIPADTELSITTALVELAVTLGMPAELLPRELASRAREALASQVDWLLVFDNARHPTEVARFLPAAGGGHVLITSRNPAWQGIADPLPVDVLPLHDAVKLLRTRSGDTDRRAAEILADELGRLPLALEQAAAYAGQHLAGNQHPLERYLTLFRERQAELLAKGRPLAYSGTVDATFTLAVDRLQESNLPAVSLLEIVALLAADELPLHLLLSEPDRLPDPIAGVARNPVAKDEMVAALFEAGLLTPDRSGLARTHRVVQIITMAHLPKSDRRQRIKQTVQLLAAIFPDEGWEPEHQPRCAQLLPHAQAVLDQAAGERLKTPDVARLLITVGHYLWGSRLALQDARDLHQQALGINQQLYEGDHPAIARSLSDFASDLRRLGELDQARELHIQALEMRQRLYQSDHPAIAHSLSNVAGDLRRLGELDQARRLDTQALEMRQRLYQSDHPDLARSLYGLAMDLRALGDLPQACQFDKQALEMRQRLYKSDHPAIAYSMGNLAVDMHLLGELDQARELNSQALAMHQRLHDGDHPDVANTLNNLANDLFALQELDQAKEVNLLALSMHQRLYEGDHSDAILAPSAIADVQLFSLEGGRRARVIDD